MLLSPSFSKSVTLRTVSEVEEYRWEGALCPFSSLDPSGSSALAASHCCLPDAVGLECINALSQSVRTRRKLSQKASLLLKASQKLEEVPAGFFYLCNLI
ncbi:MAG: hypothetical protein ACM3KM_02000 [Acidobacteriaceae bacterium]